MKKTIKKSTALDNWIDDQTLMDDAQEQPAAPSDKEVLNITNGEWRFDGLECVIDEQGLIIADIRPCNHDGEELDSIFNSNQEQAEANAKAICNAVNNTYGKGYRPESLEELYNVLAECREWYENNFDRLKPDTPICFSKALTALNNAKL